MEETKFQKMLNTIKPELRDDKDYTIKKLEESNNILLGQNESYRRVNITMKKKLYTKEKIQKDLRKHADQELRKSFNNKCKELGQQIEKYKKAFSIKKTAHHRTEQKLKFLMKRIKEKLGRQVFMDLVNHVDNPDEGGIILNKEKFLSYD